MVRDDDALLALLGLLRQRAYSFVTPTPATHARILARRGRRSAKSLEDILGWNLPFTCGTIDPPVEEMLDAAGMTQKRDGLSCSLIRVSSLNENLYLHSAYPTDDPDSVFFGPDSYRFADLIAAELADCRLEAGQLIVDVGTGAGVGAIVAGQHCPDAAIAMTDINPAALRFARINAEAAGLDPIALQTDTLEGLDGSINLALVNAPYLIDDSKRFYRDGGGMHGAQVTLDMAGFILPRLADKGRLILYSGSAIVGGEDRMKAALQSLGKSFDCTLRYREIDPDMFGEELERSAYADVDRIAVIAAIFERR